MLIICSWLAIPLSILAPESLSYVLAMIANMKSSLSTITGIAVLGHPQLITKNSIQLDCQLYLEGSNILLGCIWFYNNNKLLFNQPGLYFIESTVSLLFQISDWVMLKCSQFTQVSSHNSSLALPKGNYDFVGNLQWVCFSELLHPTILISECLLGPLFQWCRPQVGGDSAPSFPPICLCLGPRYELQQDQCLLHP